MSAIHLQTSLIPPNMENKYDRKRWLDEGMCAFVSWQWVEPFAQWIGKRRCLEIMAGRGLLAYALKKRGTEIVATDNFIWQQEDLHPEWNSPVIDVEEIDCLKAIRKYGQDAELMIMSWPPYNERIAYYALKEFYRVNREGLVVYIGEERGGHTADDLFFDHFKPVPDREFKQVTVRFENWYGINDYPQLGRYFQRK